MSRGPASGTARGSLLRDHEEELTRQAPQLKGAWP